MSIKIKPVYRFRSLLYRKEGNCNIDSRLKFGNQLLLYYYCYLGFNFCAMVESCSAINCNKRRKKGVKLKFHRIPKDPNARQAWLLALGRMNFHPTERKVVCENHFTDEDYEINSHGNRVLKKGAVPSIFAIFQPDEMLTEVRTVEPGIEITVPIIKQEVPSLAEKKERMLKNLYRIVHSINTEEEFEALENVASSMELTLNAIQEGYAS